MSNLNFNNQSCIIRKWSVTYHREREGRGTKKKKKTIELKFYL